MSGKTTHHVADSRWTTTDEASTANGRAIVLALKKGGGGPKSPFPRGAVSLDRTKYQQYDADLNDVFALAALEAQRLADEYWPEGEKYPVNYESNGAPGGRDFSNNRNGGKKSGGGGGTAHKSERAQTHRVASQEDDECDEDVDYDDDIDYVSHRGGRFLRPFLHRLLRPRTRGAGVAGGSRARSDHFYRRHARRESLRQ